MPFADYLKELQKNLKGRATERTYYPALKSLLEALDPGVEVFIEAGHVTAVGNLDFEVRRKMKGPDLPLGWVEAKEPGADLDAIEKSDQLKRYRKLHNLVLTDFVEFRLYQQGKRILAARLGTVEDSKLRHDAKGEAEVRQLLGEFLRASLAPPRNPKELAKQMATLAHIIRDITLNTFNAEPETGELHAQFEAFRQTLIPDLKPDQFADMYAQTVAYGLFAAACQPRPATEAFTREKAAYLIPKTNPFLRRLFARIAGPELPEGLQPFVNNLAALLARADFDSILADFGKRTGKEDPVVHFYEDFLQAYDPKVREMRGVYYTPEPVVSYIVRSIDYLLKTRFNKPDGLADPGVLILDPACGTGTFLYYVIRHIYDHQCAKGQKGAWNSYVSQNLLKRVFGFELLMAPYAVAHLKLGLLLQELGYTFDTDERLGIYLTNTLEEAIKQSERLYENWIAEEGNAAADIKRDKPIMVVLGNPPYSNFGRVNRGKWILDLLKDYKKGLKEKKLNIDDDFIKFIRFGQWRIDRTGHGILGFITNNTYLDGITHRRMRESLLETFDEAHLVDLHGNVHKKERAPDGSKDENVFDIRQGTAIAVLLKGGSRQGSESRVFHAELWGSRERKYSALLAERVDSLTFVDLQPKQPQFFFVPRKEEGTDEFEKAWSVKDVFLLSKNGVKTDRDELFVDADKGELADRMHRFFSPEGLELPFRKEYRVEDSSSYQLLSRREACSFEKKNLREFLYRPFDIQWIYYDPGLTSRPAHEVMRHLIAGRRANIGIIFMRQVAVEQPYSHFFVSRVLVDNRAFYSNKGIMSLAPLYLYEESGSTNQQIDLLAAGHCRPNLAPEFLSHLESQLRVKLVHTHHGDLDSTVGPGDFFEYMYAVFHSPTYRQRYEEFLKIDFPRVPLTSDKALFRALVEKGRELVALHLLESPKVNEFITTFPESGDNTVEKVRWEPEKQVPRQARDDKRKDWGRVYINKTQYFDGVPKDVWEFHIGGYQVCEKWLKDRKGRRLSADDIAHYQKVVVALDETIRLMREIDEVIPGWPLP
ncbi:MAG TPA: type ISP restriction/modification enzyme [Candidatus Xenobia bacterium]|nr:type ISP restriction/modification enzyme [Candidatus Xenobia bacterium]